MMTTMKEEEIDNNKPLPELPTGGNEELNADTDIVSLTLQVEEALNLARETIYTKSEKKDLMNKLLHRLTSSGDAESIHCCLKNEEIAEYIDVNNVDEDGSTPLIYACCFGYYDVAKLLVLNGAKVDAQDRNGWSSLLWATSNNHKEIVQLLMEHGASPGARTTKGRTVLDIINHGLIDNNAEEKNTKLQEILTYNKQHRQRQSIQSFSSFSSQDYRMDLDNLSLRSLPLLDENSTLEVLQEKEDRGGELKLLSEDLENLANSDNYGFNEDTLEDLTNEDFNWDICLPDQMFVFSNQQVPHILGTIITTMKPNPSKEQKSVPANVLFLCSRFAFYYSTPDLLEDLLKNALKAIADCVKAHFSELNYLAFWLANTSQLLYYLKKDSGLVGATVEHQLALSELIHEIYQLFVRNMQTKIEVELEPSILECESIPGLNDESKFKDKRKSFLSALTRFNEDEDDSNVPNGSTPLRKRLSLRRRANPSASNRRKISTPDTITNLLTSALTVLQSYQVHPMLIHHILNQLIYYITSELFNRILDTKRYCSRTRAIQIRMSVTVIEEWIRNHATSSIVSNLSHHFKSLLHLLQLLQCYSSHRSLAEFLETLQTLDTLSPLQIQLVAETYRYENDEERAPEEVTAYIQQVADRVLERKHRSTKQGKAIVVVRDLEDEVTTRISRRVSFLNPENVPLPVSRTDSPMLGTLTPGSATSYEDLNRSSGTNTPMIKDEVDQKTLTPPSLVVKVEPPSNEPTPLSTPNPSVLASKDSRISSRSPSPLASPSHSRENSNDHTNYNLTTVFKDPNHLLPFSVPTHNHMGMGWSSTEHDPISNGIGLTSNSGISLNGSNNKENEGEPMRPPVQGVPTIPESVVKLLNG